MSKKRPLIPDADLDRMVQNHLNKKKTSDTSLGTTGEPFGNPFGVKDPGLFDFTKRKPAPIPGDAGFVAEESVQNPAEQTEEKKLGFGQELGLAFLSGAGGLGRMATSLGAGLIDSFTSMNSTNTGMAGGLGILADWIKEVKTDDKDGKASQYFAEVFNAPLKLVKGAKEKLAPAMDAEEFGKATEKITGLPEEFNPLSPNNATANLFKKMQVKNHEKAFANYEGGIWEAIKKGEWTTAGKLAALGTAESLPIMIGLAATRGAGATSGGSLGAMGVGTMSAEYEDLKASNPEIPKNILLANAIITGASEAGSELLGTSLIYDQALKLFKSGAKEEAKKALRTGLKGYVDAAFRKAFVGVAALDEGSTEAVNQIVKNAIDKWSGVRPDVGYTDGAMDAFVVGNAAGSAFSAPFYAASRVYKAANKKSVRSLSDQNAAIGPYLEGGNLSPATKEKLIAEVASNTEKINDIFDQDAAEAQKLSPAEKTKVESINKEIDQKEQIIADPSIPAPIRDATKKAISELEANADEVVKQAEVRMETIEKAKEGIQTASTPEQIQKQVVGIQKVADVAGATPEFQEAVATASDKVSKLKKDAPTGEQADKVRNDLLRELSEELDALKVKPEEEAINMDAYGTPLMRVKEETKNTPNEPTTEIQGDKEPGAKPVAESAELPKTKVEKTVSKEADKPAVADSGVTSTNGVVEPPAVKETIVEPENAPVEKIKAPSAEQKFEDIKAGNTVTFIYGTEKEIPSVLKDKVSSRGEINGKKEIKVTLSKSEADYLLGKNEIKPVKEVVSPKSENVEAPQEQVTTTPKSENIVEDNYLATNNKTKNIDVARQLLKKLGVEADFSGYSDTNGVSVYFKDAEGKKIRVSNHGISNKDRMANEVSLNFDQKTLGIGGKQGFMSNLKMNELVVNDYLNSINKPAGAKPKDEARSVRNEKIDDDIDAAFKDFAKSLGKTLGSNVLSSESIEKGLKLVSLYTKKGVYKFTDMVQDAYDRFGDQVKDIVDGMKAAYSSYYSTAEDDVADQMTDPKELRKFNIDEFLNSGEQSAVEVADREVISKDDQLRQSINNDPDVREVIERNPDRSFVEFVKESLLPEATRLNIVSMRSKAKALGVDWSDTQIQERAELAVIETAREVALNRNLTNEDKLTSIESIYNQQPTISQRSSERIAKQQYSTPIPMSFIGGLFGEAINPRRIFEPSAGNGMLTIAFDPEKIWVNEIDPERLLMLEDGNYRGVTDQDATLPFPNYTLRKYNVVISNPPFGKSPTKNYDGYKIAGLDEQMIINALDVMSDDGRAVFIMGGNNSYDNTGRLKSERTFFNYLYNKYNVVDVINMDGSLYQRQGTTFPTRMILIEGRKAVPSGFAPNKNASTDGPVKTYEELYNRVNNHITQNENRNLLQSEMDAIGNLGNPIDVPGSTGIQNTQSDTVNPSPQNTSGGTIEGSAGSERTGNRSDTGQTGLSNTGEQFGRDSGRTPADGSVRSLDAEGGRISGQSNQTGSNKGRIDAIIPGKQPISPVRESSGELIENDKVPYVSRSKGNPVGSVIPSNMATETEKVLHDIEVEYGNIDAFVGNELGYKTLEEVYNAFSAEQVDALAMAINQIKNGKALIVGDMTGVGKGRIAAGIIRYALHNGEKPIFLTEKPTLFSDLYRDMVDIGSPSYVPFIVNDKSADNDPTITDAEGNVVFKMTPKPVKAQAMKIGEVPDGFDYVMATYSQFTSSAVTDKKRFLRAIAPGSILVMDESHNVSGESNSGGYFQAVLESVKGVAYLSATFAKKPKNMPVYAMKTSMSDANMSKEDLIAAIEGGGVALQEIVSSQLVESGQMVRRERDFTDVVNEFITLEESKEEHRDRADIITDIIRDVISFQRNHVRDVVVRMDAEAQEESGAGFAITKGTSMAGVSNTPFASKVFNVINQMLFSIKAERVAEEAIRELKNNKKPVIAFNSTMESFLKNEGYSIGDTLEDTGFTLSLIRALTGTLKITKTDAGGNKESSQIHVSQISPEGQEEYKNIEEKIRNASSGISISPIDVIIKKIEAAGYTVGEITRRGMRLDLQDDGTANVVPRAEKDTKKIVRDFNNNSGVDVVLLNASGATGLSMHASAKFKDQRERVMITHQLELDINKEVQKRGRIDRSGQMRRGRYKYMVSAIPAEKRLLMMFQAKLKSLDANATSSQKSNSTIEVADFLNKYGDRIVVDYLKENTEMNNDLLDPFGFDKKTVEELTDYKGSEGDASKASGRVAILPSEKQEQFYNEISERYLDLITYLNDNGLNDLEVKSLPLEAETTSRTTFKAGKGGNSPFGKDSVLETVMVNVLKKPLTKDELEAELSESLGESTPSEIQRKSLRDMDDFFAKRLADDRSKITERYQAKLTKAEKDYSEYPAEFLEISNKIEADLGAELEAADNKSQMANQNIARSLNAFRIGEEYDVPDQIMSGMTTYSPGIFLGFKIKEDAKNPYAPSNVKMRFATLDGRRKVEPPLSQGDFVNAAIAGIYNKRGGYFSGSNKKTLRDQWVDKISTSTREKRNIITGNILQAYDGSGQLVAYTTKDGGLKKGILLPKSFKMEENSVQVPILRAMDQFLNLDRGDRIFTSDHTVSITKEYSGNYGLQVPMSKVAGGKYFLDPELRGLVVGNNFESRRGRMEAEFYPENLERILAMLQNKFGKSVPVKDYIGEAETQEAEPQKEDPHSNIKGVLDFLDNSKIQGGKAFGMIVPIPPVVFNGAIDIIKEAIKAGNTVQQAIRKAIKHLRDNRSTDEQIEDFTALMSEKLGRYSDLLDNPTTTLKNADTDAKRDDYGFDQYRTRGGRTDARLNQEADEAISKGYDVYALMDRILDPMEDDAPISDWETVVLLKFIALKEAEVQSLNSNFNGDIPDREFAQSAEIRSKALDDLNRAYDAAKETGTTQGSALRARQVKVVRDMTLAGMFTRMRQANGGNKLTSEESQQVTDNYNAISKAQADLEAKVAKLELENAELRAKEIIKQNIANSRRKSKAVTVSQLQEEGQDILSDWRKALREARRNSLNSSIPYLQDVIASAPYIAKFAGNLAKRGFIEITDLVERVREEFIIEIPELTERDVLDIIAGKYNESPKSKSELQQQMLELKKQANLIVRIQDAMDGVESATASRKTEASARVQALRDQLDELTRDEKDLSAAKKRAKDRLAELERRIKEGDFDKAPQRTKVEDKELRDLKDRLIAAEFDYTKLLTKKQLSQRTKGEKIADSVTDVLAVVRSVMSSADYSALRQGLPLVASHPIIGAKAFIEMHKMSVDQKRYNRWMYDLQNSDAYKLMQKSGLYISDVNNAKLSAKEEEFTSNLAEKIPILGTHIVKGSNRAYTGFLNKMRVDVFNQMAGVLKLQGYTYENRPDLYKFAADFVNNASGRGTLGQGKAGQLLEKFAPTLSSVFFSPRVIASRLTLLNPLYYAKIPKELRKMVWGDMAKFAVLATTVLFMFDWSGDDDDENDFQVEWNPLSTDFGKIRLGDTRWDILAGFSQYIRFAAQFALQKRKSTTTGKISDIDKNKFPFKSPMDLPINFGRSKLAPIPAIGWNLIEGQDMIGNKFGYKDIIPSIMPLVYQDVYDAVKEQGPKALLTTMLPAIYGVGVQTYKPKEKKEDERPRAVNY